MNNDEKNNIQVKPLKKVTVAELLADPNFEPGIDALNGYEVIDDPDLEHIEELLAPRLKPGELPW